MKQYYNDGDQDLISKLGVCSPQYPSRCTPQAKQKHTTRQLHKNSQIKNTITQTFIKEYTKQNYKINVQKNTTCKHIEGLVSK